ncbi:MAG: TM2 domain-containing protein [Clostridiales bacterium]|nr:TM2 domain-containing protein [Clostridiales bacterium]
METIKCPECNCKISDKALSCPKCGRPLSMGSAFNDFPPLDAGIYTSNEDIYAQNMEESLKSRLVAFLLCFFLGCFGAHRFYVGKTKSAILMIVLCILVIPSTIWAFVDFVMIICGTFTDSEGLPLKRWE